jgi:electron transfer flavoprotein alpha subunit
MGSILIVAEIQGGQIREASYEIASIAQEIAGASGRDVKSVVMGKSVEALAQEFSQRGGGTVYAAENDLLENYSAETSAMAIRAAIEASGADLILLSNTPSGWDVAPRIAAALEAGFISDCFGVGVEGGNLSFKRRIFNGKLDARLSASSERVVATIQPGAVQPFEGSSEGSVEKLAVDIDAGALRSKFVKTKKVESQGVDLSKAEIIIAGGRGVGGGEKFEEVLKPLADALGGAMGASRPVVDAGWLAHEYQVGSSGQVVSPKLYIAAGISGAIQHLVGMKGSNFIVAINKDADAPIFEVADLGVVGDLLEVIPALTKAVQDAKGG